VVQAAVVNFAEWIRNPASQVGYTAQAFELVPQDLTSKIALAQTVDMVRVSMEYFEEVIPMVARNAEQMTALTVAILRYSRDLAFAAASAYADAAEARGSWDSRMEASVVDAVVRGDTGPELLSRAAALNWDTTAPATVVVGTPPPDREDLAGEDVREIAVRHDRLSGASVAIQSSKLPTHPLCASSVRGPLPKSSVKTLLPSMSRNIAPPVGTVAGVSAPRGTTRIVNSGEGRLPADQMLRSSRL
jgi:hypothetical protein